MSMDNEKERVRLVMVVVIVKDGSLLERNKGKK